MDDETKPKQLWTEGEWRLTGPVGKSGWIESEANGTIIAAVHKVATPEGCANSVLIAAAPAMAEALAKLVAEYEEDAKYDIDGVLRCDWKTRKVVDSPEIAAARVALDACGWQWGKP